MVKELTKLISIFICSYIELLNKQVALPYPPCSICGNLTVLPPYQDGDDDYIGCDRTSTVLFLVRYTVHREASKY